MMITVRHITDFLEHRALPSLTLSYDNVGLQAGSFDAHLTGILTTLDLTDAVIDEAIEKKANLIIAHHPIIFPHISAVTTNTESGRLLIKLIKHDINLFVSHTNLDSIRGGVSFVLAEKLGLQSTHFLAPAESYLQEITLKFPVSSKAIFLKLVQNFSHAISHQSYFSDDKSEYAQLFVEESVLAEVIKNLKQIPNLSFDKQRTSIKNPEFGFGAIGDLPVGKPFERDSFLTYVSEQLGVTSFRYTGSRNQIKRIAVCGGSGSNLLSQAIRQKADAYITADIKYHDYFIPDSDLLFLDIGHFETEHFITEALQRLLTKSFSQVPVFKTEINTNPMKVFIHPKYGIKTNPSKSNKAQ
jgi:dinuclear metal center YbgI/SA1388 family protein